MARDKLRLLNPAEAVLVRDRGGHRRADQSDTSGAFSARFVPLKLCRVLLSDANAVLEIRCRASEFISCSASWLFELRIDRESLALCNVIRRVSYPDEYRLAEVDIIYNMRENSPRSIASPRQFSFRPSRSRYARARSLMLSSVILLKCSSVTRGNVRRIPRIVFVV